MGALSGLSGLSRLSGLTGGSTAPVPNPPSNLNVGGGLSDDVLDLSWTDNSDDETGFEIRRSTNGGSSWSTIETTESDATSYADEGLPFGKRHDYQVRAVGAEGNSAWSTPGFATTGAPIPGGLTATAVSATQIDLAWNDESNGQASTKILRDGALIATVPVGMSTYSDTGLEPSTTYPYRVVHVYENAESDPSDEANDTTDPGGFDPGPHEYKFGGLSHNSLEPGYFSRTPDTDDPYAPGWYFAVNILRGDGTNITSSLDAIDVGAVVSIGVPSKSTVLIAEIAGENSDPVGSGVEGNWEIVNPPSGDWDDPDAEDDPITLTIITPV